MPLGPRSKERPADAGVTLVGGLDSATPAAVDGAGLVTAAHARWSLDWWIGAADRWYFPSREPAVRQRRVGFGPVIETSVRIPEGDAVQTVYPVVLADGEATVIEVRNDSSVPVALAVAIRPYRADGLSVGAEIDVSGTDTILVDGSAGVILPRSANQRTVSAIADVADRLSEAGADEGIDLGDEATASGLEANAALIYPLPHGTTLRFVVPSENVGTVAAIDRLPAPTSAAKGWDSVVEASARFDFADEAVTNLANAARARLLLGDCRPSDPIRPSEYGPILAGLAHGGHDAEARRWLVALAQSFPTSIPDPSTAADLLVGLGLAAATADAAELTDALLEPAAQLAYLVERAKPAPPVVAKALDGLSRLLVVADQPEPARELADRASSLASSSGEPSEAAYDRLVELGQTARSTGRFGLDDSAIDAARYWSTARSLMLDDRTDRTIDLLPVFPTAWRGGGVEVHQAPTLYGHVSFAIRWHGPRPALLWEVSPRPPAAGGTIAPVRLRCPSLDPDWSTTDTRGETLLAGSSEGLPDAPSQNDSFN